MAGQVAFSLVMLVVAGLFVRSLSDLRPAGFAGATDRVLLFTMKFQPEQYRSEQVRVLVDRLRTRMAAIPGVQTVALAETGPLASRRSTTQVRVGGRDSVLANADYVTPGFFDGVGLRLIAGRDFRPSDSPSAARVVIINATLARRLFAGEQPIGRTVELGSGQGIRTYEVIGVAADAGVRLHARVPGFTR